MTAPALGPRWIIVPTDQLIKAAWNYKLEDAVLAAKLEANLKANGQIENLVVREFTKAEKATRRKAGEPVDVYEVANGNHRLDPIAKLIGHAVCYNLGPVSKQAAARRAIELNETRFETDYGKMAVLLAEMVAAGDGVPDLAATLPFSDEQLRHYVDLTGFDWTSLATPDPDPPVTEDATMGRRSTKMHHIDVTEENFVTIGRAIEVLRNREHDGALTEGRALELICADYLSGPGPDGEA